MKKITKIVLFVCAIALILFLLLPFLETSSPKKNVANGTDAKAQPQIFTSNPLTELVGRIARFFNKRQTAEEHPRTMSAAEADEMFGPAQNGPRYAAADNPQSAGASQFPADAYAANFYPQNEDGDWVLIRQTAPEGATRGMHEINVKDNAYDRYVAQERQARFTPVMRQPSATQAVPDSRLARIFSPVKHLFGAGEKSAASGALTADASAVTAARGVSSSGLDRNKAKSSRPLPARPAGWNAVTNNPFSSLIPGSAEAAQAMANLLDPSYEIDKTAEWLANLKYPNAQTDPQAQQAKQEFEENLTRQKTQQTFREMQELMVRRNAGQGPVNVLENTFGCGDGSVSKKKLCSMEEDARPQTDFSALKQTNAQRFLEQTGHTLPPSGITVILNSSDLPVLDEDVRDEMLEEMPAAKSQTAQFYLFMQEQCQNNCYWVATGADQNSELANTIKGVGLTFKGDPFNRYPQYMQNFLEEKRQAGQSEEEIKEIKQLLEENQPHYVAYAEQDIYRLAQDSKEMMKQHAQPEEATVPFFTHVQNAFDFYQRTNYPRPLLYGNGSAVDGDKDLAERTGDFTDELIQFVNDAQTIRQKAKGEMAQEGTQTMAQPAMRQIQEKLKNDMENFSQTNDVGTYQK